MERFNMDGQLVLTKYFNASKSRPVLHPAKRRKIETENNVAQKKLANSAEGKCQIEVEKNEVKHQKSVSRVASGITRKVNRSKSKGRKSVKRKNFDKSVHSDVMSITTSAKDDHESQRSRKQLQPMLKNGLEPKGHAENRAKELAGKGVSIPEEKCQKEENVSHLNESVDDLQRNTEDRIDSIKEQSVDVSSVKAIINNQPCNDIKVNPWIAEQAKLVLASRGKQALEKSLQKKKDSATKKNDNVIVKGDNKGLSKGIPSFKNIKPTMELPRLSEEATMKAEKISPSSGTKCPAYQRFGHLLEAKKPAADQATRNLPLPYHFKMLEEMFRCVDVVLSLKQKRHESCTFEKLKYSVQEMTRKKFEKKHLAQIKTIYPDAFVFRQQSTSVGGKKSSFQLMISLNLNGKQAKDVKFVESSVFTERLKHFKNKLLEVTMEHHQDYLAKNYPRLCVKNEEIMRWHPCFPLDKIPELEQAALPEPPQMETFTSARDVLDKARLNMSPRVENALKNVAQSSLEKNSDKTQSKTNKFEMNSNQAAKNHNPSLRGVAQSLIDKIRLKEEKKIQEALTVDSEVVKKRAMLQRLPEFSRILKTYFVGERKIAIPLEDVIGKIAESFTSTMSTVEVEKHVRLLCETLPEWLSITHVRKCPYVKLKKNVNFNSLVDKLKAKERN